MSTRFKKAKLGDLPPKQAATLGLAIPPLVAQRTDETIEEAALEKHGKRPQANVPRSRRYTP